MSKGLAVGFGVWLQVFLLFAHGACEPKIVDSLVAVVNDQVITSSDLRLENIYFSPADSTDGEKTQLEVLMSLINRRLIVQEVTRLGFSQVDGSLIEKKYEQLKESYGGTGSFEDFLEKQGAVPRDIKQLIREKLLVDKFIDIKFRPYINPAKIKLSQEEIDQLIPPQDQEGISKEVVHEAALKIAVEQRINQRLKEWLDEAWKKAQIVIRY